MARERKTDSLIGYSHYQHFWRHRFSGLLDRQAELVAVGTDDRWSSHFRVLPLLSAFCR